MAIAVLSATSLVGVGWIAHDLSSPAATTTPVSAANSNNSTTAIPAQQPGVQTPVINVTGDEPAEAVAQALSPAVVQIENDEGLGSGVVYDQGGLVMTNAHVVGTSTTVTVRFSDGNQTDGTVVGSDPSSDIAVVKIESMDHVKVARLSAEPAKVGQMAIALGSPFGLSQSVTAGIVSAVDRPVTDQQTRGASSRSAIAINMIQTDAPINPGNSGGALANRNGEVIGVNTAIFSQTGENNGIGFAIPIQTAKNVADKIVKGESLDKGYLGVTAKTPTTGDAGAQLVTVEAGSPASKAGLKRGDIIQSIDGQAVKGSLELNAAIAAHAPNDVINLQILRGSESLTIEVTLGKKS